jgi:tRNA(Ile)-lysidine synthase
MALSHLVFSLHEELGIRLSTLTVDHSLQENSAQWTEQTVLRLKELGIQDAYTAKVEVELNSENGLEAAARSARYQALQAKALEIYADAILLAHTLDDQAETVLLRLAQGASTNSIASMRAIQGNLWRPLLKVRRPTLRGYLEDVGVPAVDDPHNYDRRFTRVRVREELLPLLLDVIGKDVVNSLSVTARLAAIDSDTLDVITDIRYEIVVSDGVVNCERLKEELPAIQLRILYRWLGEIGAQRFGNEHVFSVLRLATENQLKGPLRVPGSEIQKVSGTLRAVRSTDG